MLKYKNPPPTNKRGGWRRALLLLIIQFAENRKDCNSAQGAQGTTKDILGVGLAIKVPNVSQ